MKTEAEKFVKLTAASIFAIVSIGGTFAVTKTEAQEICRTSTTQELQSLPILVEPPKNVFNTLGTIRLCSSTTADSKSELRNEIINLGVFLRGWDGGEAEPIAKDSIESALKFIEEDISQLPFDAYPDPDGSVGLQADLADGRILLSFAEDGTVAYLIRIGNAVHRGRGANYETVNKLFATLI